MGLHLCSYNIEWFDKLFEKNNSLKADPESKDRLDAIGAVLREIDADMVGVIEAPNHMSTGQKKTVSCLTAFAQRYNLRTREAIIGFPSAGKQEVAIIYDPVKAEITHVPGGGGKKNPPFNRSFEFDTDEDRIKEIYKFYRPPLEVEVRETATGNIFRLIVVHAKSKGIFGSADLVHWERENYRNRRKLFAECSWVRLRVEEWLDEGNEVVVMGDINDGPGMDHYEFQFGRSAVEIIMGDLYEPQRILKSHVARPKWGRYGWEPSSTRFKDRLTETQVNVLIDHILVSQGLAVRDGSHIVWNPFQVAPAKAIKDELLVASDHFPVSLDLV